MSLDRYVYKLKLAKDGDLSPKYGITYDWPILLKVGFEKLTDYLNTAPIWRYSAKATAESGLKELGKVGLYFRQATPALSLQVMGWVAPVPTQDPVLQEKINDYNTSIWIGWQGEEKPLPQGMSNNRVIASAVSDLAQLIKDKRIPAWLPRAKLDGKKGVFYEP